MRLLRWPFDAAVQGVDFGTPRVLRGFAGRETPKQDDAGLRLVFAQPFHDSRNAFGDFLAGVAGGDDVVDADHQDDDFRFDAVELAVLETPEDVFGSVAGEAEGDGFAGGAVAVDHTFALGVRDAFGVAGEALGDRVAEEDDLDVRVGRDSLFQVVECLEPNLFAPAGAGPVFRGGRGDGGGIGRAPGGGEQESAERIGRVEPVRVVVLARLVPDFHRAAEFCVVGGEHVAIFRGRHHRVGGADDQGHGDLRPGQRHEEFRIEGLGESGGLLFGDAVGLQASLPVAIREFPMFAAGPRAEVAHRVVAVDGGDAVRVAFAPEEDWQAAARHPFEHGLRGELEFAGCQIIEGVPAVERLRRAEEIRDIAEGDVESAVEQRKLQLRFVAEEPRAPDPRVPFGGLVRGDDDAGCGVGARQLEIETPEAVEIPGFCRDSVFLEVGGDVVSLVESGGENVAEEPGDLLVAEVVRMHSVRSAIGRKRAGEIVVEHARFGDGDFAVSSTNFGQMGGALLEVGLAVRL